MHASRGSAVRRPRRNESYFVTTRRARRRTGSFFLLLPPPREDLHAFLPSHPPNPKTTVCRRGSRRRSLAVNRYPTAPECRTNFVGHESISVNVTVRPHTCDIKAGSQRRPDRPSSRRTGSEEHRFTSFDS